MWKVLDRENTRAIYTIKKKMFTPMYKGLNEKIVSLEICNSCMSEIIEEVLKKTELKEDMKRKKNKKLFKNEKLSAGWLSPSGEYFRLESHHLCHEDLAQEILSGEDYFEESELAMNVLLKRKWAIIRDKGFYCSKMSYFVWWGLTVVQKHFLKIYIEDGEIIEADIY